MKQLVRSKKAVLHCCGMNLHFENLHHKTNKSSFCIAGKMI